MSCSQADNMSEELVKLRIDEPRRKGGEYCPNLMQTNSLFLLFPWVL